MIHPDHDDEALMLWKHGLDTYDISRLWGVPEDDVWRQLIIIRERERKNDDIRAMGAGKTDDELSVARCPPDDLE